MFYLLVSFLLVHELSCCHFSGVVELPVRDHRIYFSRSGDIFLQSLVPMGDDFIALIFEQHFVVLN
jgi:hypothetical protein